MNRFIEKYNKEEFDIIIIGGGITGASVAYDAACKGLKVALLERKDFGGQTSAATSKLIHGGLRYLTNLEFGLVRESLRERRNLENIAPNLVYPIQFMIPHYKKFRDKKLLVKAGLNLYDMLSFDRRWTWDAAKKIDRHKSISMEKVLKVEPNIRDRGLTGASIYYDCQNIFPERLTLAFIKSAVNNGAKVANYAMVNGFIYKNGKSIAGVKVLDVLNNKEIEIKGKLTINCGGPWTDIILNIAEKGESHHQIRRSEGIHIITKKLVNDHAVVLLTPKGRHFFIIPWRGHSLIGTTDEEYVGNPDDYKVAKESIEGLIQEVNESFGDGSLTYKDIKYSYGGLRPIVDGDSKVTYTSSRKYEIHDNAMEGFEGIMTVEGGKYTTSRNLAANALKMAATKMNISLGKTKTDKVFLYGCDIKDIHTFLKSVKAENRDLSEKTLEYIGKNFGTEHQEVLKIAGKNKKLSEPINDNGEILAEVIYAVRKEMAKTLPDILLRRTGIGSLGHPGNDILKKVAEIAAEELNWDESRLKEEVAEVKKILSLP